PPFRNDAPTGGAHGKIQAVPRQTDSPGDTRFPGVAHGGERRDRLPATRSRSGLEGSEAGRAADRDYLSLGRRPRGESIRARTFARLCRRRRGGYSGIAAASRARSEMDEPKGDSAGRGRNCGESAGAQRAPASDGKDLAWRETERTSRRLSASGRR